MKPRLLGLLFAGMLLIPVGALAQQSASSGLVGLVTDSSQGAIPGATVTVTNVGTNAQRTVVTDGEGRFSVPALPPATYHIKVELQGFQTAELSNFVLSQGETARPTITLGSVTVSGSDYRDGRVAAAADAERVGRPGDQRETDREPPVGQSQRAVAGVALRGRHPAQLRARHTVRTPQSVHDGRRRTRQLDELHDRWRVRAVPAFQQPLAEPARGRRPGSQPPPQLLLHRIWPGAGCGLDRDEVGDERVARFRLRVLPQRAIRCAQFLRADEAGLQAQPVRRDCRRANRSQQVLRVRRV